MMYLCTWLYWLESSWPGPCYMSLVQTALPPSLVLCKQYWNISMPLDTTGYNDRGLITFSFGVSFDAIYLLKSIQVGGALPIYTPAEVALRNLATWCILWVLSRVFYKDCIICNAAQYAKYVFPSLATSFAISFDLSASLSSPPPSSFDVCDENTHLLAAGVEHLGY